MNNIPKLYIARHFDHKILSQSSSGGIFYACASAVLNDGGVIYGVGFNEAFIPHYIRAEHINDVIKMISSKYVEAAISHEIFTNFLADVQSSKKILFSGTPCQIEGMISICKNKHLNINNVYFIDFFTCSGVPSRKLWKKKLAETYEKNSIAGINFRSKYYGWRNFSFEVILKKSQSKQKRAYFALSDWGRLFLTVPHSCRQACSSCLFLTKKRKSDISLGDMWDASYIPYKWQDDKGVSIVMINTAKGEHLFDKISFFAELIEIPEKAGNWAGLDKKSSCSQNLEERKLFWNFFNENGYQKVIKKYCTVSCMTYIKFAILKPFLIKTGLIRIMDKMIYRAYKR